MCCVADQDGDPGSESDALWICTTMTAMEQGDRKIVRLLPVRCVYSVREREYPLMAGTSSSRPRQKADRQAVQRGADDDGRVELCEQFLQVHGILFTSGCRSARGMATPACSCGG